MTPGVLLMAHGTPERVEDVGEFLGFVIQRRRPTPAFIEEVRERYRKIGGRSPLTEVTRRQARDLQDWLGIPVFVGMRYWWPFIADAVEEARSVGIDMLVGLPMAPQHAPISVSGYHEAMAKALPKGMDAVQIMQWHREPSFLQAWAERLPIGKKVLFTAHSIPVENSAPYPDHIKETIEGIVKRRPGLDWDFAYQSRSPDPSQPWLEPDVNSVLDRLAGQGVKEVVFAPIGFVSDHVEVLYDLDILHAGHAASIGIRASRAPSLNDSPLLIEALASAVRKALK
ncbi:MAG TPA: ferrochelatase [Planctomycetota bacterium]|nr:ferrochelatase [Planctomycetota bacterium]